MGLEKKFSERGVLIMAKVLIIEDRRENIVFIANNILKPMGYEVFTARDGQMGLEKAEEIFPDLIITDIKLPRMSGLEVMEKLLEKGIMIPTIVMTFHGTEETAVQALRLGARDYLIKPFTMEDIETALDRALKPRPVTPEAYREKLESQARIKTLEEESRQMRELLMRQAGQIKEFEKQLSKNDNQAEIAQAVEQASVWEEDNARLNKMLAEAKYALSKAEGRADALNEAMTAQQTELSKYRKETKRLADELRNLSEAIRLMSQDMENQMGRITILTPQEEH